MNGEGLIVDTYSYMDSDFDKAIDGGESNIYPGKPVDIDGDGVIDSGKTI